MCIRDSNEIGYMPQIGRYPENMTIANIFEMMKAVSYTHLDVYKRQEVNYAYWN